MTFRQSLCRRKFGSLQVGRVEHKGRTAGLRRPALSPGLRFRGVAKGV